VAKWLGERLREPYRYKYAVTENDMPMARQYQPPAIREE
jgi:hypothetical protein